MVMQVSREYCCPTDVPFLGCPTLRYGRFHLSLYKMVRDDGDTSISIDPQEDEFFAIKCPKMLELGANNIVLFLFSLSKGVSVQFILTENV